jgi:hypothetical protein
MSQPNQPAVGRAAVPTGDNDGPTLWMLPLGLPGKYNGIPYQAQWGTLGHYPAAAFAKPAMRARAGSEVAL